MYNNKTISVAIASYNGEKYLQEQIDSICTQTIPPDEIIISDDGSRDGTISLIKKLEDVYAAKNISIVLLTDNPRHGYCGNFEWAISHTHGDYIFVSDQDDVWYENKIQSILQIFDLHPDAECIIHEADLINQDGEKIEGVFNRYSKSCLLDKGVEDLFHLDRDIHLEAATSAPLANGMVLCLSRKSLDSSLPFPKCDGSHDGWLIFSAICNDKCWYTPEILEHYRLHDANTCGNRAYRGSRLSQIRRKMKKLKINGVRSCYDLYLLGEQMMKSMEKVGYTDPAAYETARRVYEIGNQELKAVGSGRVSGAWQLYRLYKTDIRYRSIGKASFICQLLRILIYSKKNRRKQLGI